MFKRNKIKIWAGIIAGVFLVGVLLAGLLPLFASAAPSLDEQIKNEQTKQKELEDKIENANEQKSATMEKKKVIDEEIAVIQGDIDVINGELATLNAQIEQKNNEIKVAQKQIDENRAKYKLRVKVLYEEGGSGYLKALLEATSVNDMLYRYEIMQEILLHDKELIAKMEAAKLVIEVAKAEIEKDKATVNTQKTALGEKKTLASSKQKEQQKIIDDLKKNTDAWQKQLDAAEAAEAALKKQVAASASKSGDGTTYTGGKFAWPAPGNTRITSPFSEARMHPVLGYTRRHDGIDIGCPQGSNVIAAGDGTVIFAGWNGGYGNCVIVDHGGGYTTLYGHGSKILVSKGQKVTRGQGIMLSGNTGTSTGPHLHFEVCINGVAKEPTQFLK